MGDAKAFKSGRSLPAWLGLVPRRTGTGGRIRLWGNRKRGNSYLPRCWFAARSMLTHAKEAEACITALRQRPLAAECGCRRVGEQVGAYDLGLAGA